MCIRMFMCVHANVCLKFLYTYVHLCCDLFVSYMFLFVGFIQQPMNGTFCEGSNAMLSCITFDNSTNAAGNANWFMIIDDDFPADLPNNMISNTRNGDVATSVLTIESVSLNDNNNGYYCMPSTLVVSNVGVILVAGKYPCIRMYDLLSVHTYV